MAKSKDDKSTSSSSSKSNPSPEWAGNSPGKREVLPGLKGVHSPADWSVKKIRQMVKDHPQIKKHFKNI